MNICILGSGRIATALAQVLTDNDNCVMLWSIDAQQTELINNNHINHTINYSRTLSHNIFATTSMATAIAYSSIIIIAVPSFVIPDVVTKMIKEFKDNRRFTIINVAKGLIPQTGAYLHTYLQEAIPKNCLKYLCSLTGPSFAHEILARQITHLNLTSIPHHETAEICTLFNNHYFLVEPTPWVEELAFLSCYKNVIALFSGMLTGYKFQSNAKAIFFVKALLECQYLFTQLGLDKQALISYGGLGDLILTCSSEQSRNFLTGIQIATSNSFSDTLMNIQKLNMTVEGIGTAIVIKKLFRAAGNIDAARIPIITAVFDVINNRPRIRDLIAAALHSPFSQLTT